LGFGGVGASGYGRYGGYEGFRNFSNRKGILIKKPAPPFVIDLASPPFTSGKKSKLRCMAPCLLSTTQQWLQRVIGFFIVLMMVWRFRVPLFGLEH
jgi:hypothetical protein